MTRLACIHNRVGAMSYDKHPTKMGMVAWGSRGMKEDCSEFIIQRIACNGNSDHYYGYIGQGQTSLPLLACICNGVGTIIHTKHLTKRV